MTKVLIAGHSSDMKSFVEDLQYASILHIGDIAKTCVQEKFCSSISQDSGPCDSDPSGSDPAGSDLDSSDLDSSDLDSSGFFGRLEESRIFLEEFIPKETFFQKLIEPPPTLKRSYYQNIIKTFNPQKLLESSSRIKSRLISLKEEQKNLTDENKKLYPWKEIEIPIKDTGIKRHANIIIGRVSNKSIKPLEDIENLDFEILGVFNKSSFVLIAIYAGNSRQAYEKLKKTGFVEIDILPLTCSPKEKYKNNLRRMDEIKIEAEELIKSAGMLLEDLDNLRILIEKQRNLCGANRISMQSLLTGNAFIIAGWIKQYDLKRLKSLVFSYETVIFEESEMTDQDSPPTAFENIKLFAPFQFITRLYDCPSYQSTDPSPFVAIFFAMFFGICLTDAGYGLILSILSLTGLRLLKRDSEILWILFWGGIFSIIAGLLTGGIFGDLLRSEAPFLNQPYLAGLREKAAWFDPMKEPMVFFRLVLLFGLIHVVTGIALGFIGNIRQKKIMNALVDNIAWILILGSIVTIIYSTQICVQTSLTASYYPPFNAAFAKPACLILALMSVVIILFSARDEKGLFLRFFTGLLKLFVLSGIFSYLGDILSYIRLMALGMVTAGIAMAVNTIAFMMYDVPVVGILLTICTLIVGHFFNMVINMLGGFVHTMRLQYVEFFSKFFIGGGQQFTPVSCANRYFKII